MYKIMLSAGEASGDLHAASVARAIKEICPDARLFGMGGQCMISAGVEVIYDIKDLGVIGLVEVIKNLRKLFRLKDELAALMDEQKPDVLVVVDYPGFNMRLAKEAKKRGIPVVSYISPSAWAWARGRAKEVAETVNLVAAIFPFEAEVYRQAGANVNFVGHPLLDIVKPSMPKNEAYKYFGAKPDKPVILLMPGSREQEIKNLLPVMLEACRKIVDKHPDCQFFLPVASTISLEMIYDILNKEKISVKLTQDKTYDLMNISNLAIAASGTATLETSLMFVPTIIIYKVNALTYFLGKFLVKIPHIGLPNIIAGRKVVPELLQSAASADNIYREAVELLDNAEQRAQTLTDLCEVREKLGSGGAVKRVAHAVLDICASHFGGNQ